MERKSFVAICSSLLIILLVFPVVALAEITYSFNTSWPDKRPYSFAFPSGVAVGGDGTLYVTDRDNDTVLAIADPGGSPQVIDWGQGGRFDLPSGIVVGQNNTVFIADTVNHRVQKWSTMSYGAGVFVSSWGTEGSAYGEFLFPSALAVDGAGSVYVADTGNNRVQKFTPDGDYLARWGEAGSGVGQFNHPSALAVDSGGNVYVVDQGNNRVQVFSSSGEFQFTFGSAGTGDGQFQGPSGIAIDGSGTVYVSDRDNHRIQKFGANGDFQGKWGTSGNYDGEMRYPGGVAVGPDGSIFVADSGNDRILQYNSQGVFLKSFSNVGIGDGDFFEPVGAAVSSGGDVYVVDSVNCRIQRFDPDGGFVSKWGGFGRGNGEFMGASGVAMDSQDNVYVVDTLNNRVQKFSSDGDYLWQWGTAGAGNGQFDYPYSVAFAGDTVYVLDSGNNRVQKFTTAGTFLAAWGSGGSGNGQLDRPMGIAADADGNILVADTGNHRVQKFSSSGAFLAAWGGLGRLNGQFMLPAALAVNQGGNVFVADTGNHRVQEFTPDGGFVRSFGTQGTEPSQTFLLTYFRHPGGIAFSPSGDMLYVADSRNNRVQKFNLGGIQITTPKPAQHLPTSSVQKIDWTYVGNPGLLLITLLKDGEFVGYIPPSSNPSYPIPTPLPLQSGKGSYDWAVPAGLASGSDYQIIMQAGASSSVSEKFSITGPQYTLGITGVPGSAGGSVRGGINLDCKVTASGTVAGTCSEYNDPNAVVVLTATPDPRASVAWTGCTSASGNSCTVSLGANRTVTAGFNLTSYAITTAPGASGVITCDPATVYHGESSVCAILPDSGYHVADVRVGPTGGTLASVGSRATYAFTGVTGNMTIAATFQLSAVKLMGASTGYYSTLAAAYAQTSDGDTIAGRAMTFEGGFNLNRLVQVRLAGGYDSSFSGQSAYSEISGAMTVALGSVTVDRIVIR